MRAERIVRVPLRGLLVVVALLGVLGMHGLMSPSGTSAAAVVSVQADHGHEHSDGGGHECPPDEGDHGAHVGEMCVANALAAPFSPSPLAAALAPATPEPLSAVRAGAVDASSAGRAPPSLSDLQLLRI
ncbi:DUF6153 family protein [Kitasatospora sp. NPDC004240]